MKKPKAKRDRKALGHFCILWRHYCCLLPVCIALVHVEFRIQRTSSAAFAPHDNFLIRLEEKSSRKVQKNFKRWTVWKKDETDFERRKRSRGKAASRQKRSASSVNFTAQRSPRMYNRLVRARAAPNWRTTDLTLKITHPQPPPTVLCRAGPKGTQAAEAVVEDRGDLDPRDLRVSTAPWDHEDRWDYREIR
ncbi:hypothetical protein OS493_037377, partial [Desmophyllum pertusum]